MVSTEGLKKAEVLAALFNASRPQGMGFLQYTPEPMSSGEASEILASGVVYFDYLKGRVMKLSLKDDAGFEEWGYDRDNGSGAAERAIAAIRDNSGNVNSPEIRQLHQVGKLNAAAQVKTKLNEETRFDGGVVTLGLSDVADVLGPAVDAAIDMATSFDAPTDSPFEGGSSDGGGASSSW